MSGLDDRRDEEEEAEFFERVADWINANPGERVYLDQVRPRLEQNDKHYVVVEEETFEGSTMPISNSLLRDREYRRCLSAYLSRGAGEHHEYLPVICDGCGRVDDDDLLDCPACGTVMRMHFEPEPPDLC